jgi:hypothetical protein
MPESEEVDEVVLNTLLAEGVDVPTAWEASRYRTPEYPTGGTGALVFYAVVLLALALGLWLLVAG